MDVPHSPVVHSTAVEFSLACPVSRIRLSTIARDPCFRNGRTQQSVASTWRDGKNAAETHRISGRVVPLLLSRPHTRCSRGKRLFGLFATRPFSAARSAGRRALAGRRWVICMELTGRTIPDPEPGFRLAILPSSWSLALRRQEQRSLRLLPASFYLSLSLFFSLE